jgi:hypothetical protein
VEAGFLEIPSSVVGTEGAGPLGRMRMFYSFRPREEAPEEAPLVVFFNGGPGLATTAGLLPFATGPMTLSGEVDGGDAPIANPASWTRFANLLYLDAPMTGFSYGLDEKGCRGKSGEAVYLADAGAFVRAVLDFLDGHPALVRAPVVLAGESYGGTRVALMLHLLQRYADPTGVFPGAITELPWLGDRVQAHFDAARPCQRGQAASPGEVALQFGTAVVIEGNFFGAAELDAEAALAEKDPLMTECAYFGGGVQCDPYDVRRTVDDGLVVAARAAATMRAERDLADLETMLGVPPARIVGLPGPDRGDAWRLWDFSPEDEASTAAAEVPLRAALGPLRSGDAYWLRAALACPPSAGGGLGDAKVFQALVAAMPTTALFFTRATYDSVVYAEAYPHSFATLGVEAEIREDLPAGAARPGMLEIRLEDGTTAEVRFPRYAAGHMVSATAGPELAEDVWTWLSEQGLAKPAP